MSLWNSAPELDSIVTSAEIYLDAAATTPPLPAVISTVHQRQQDAWANPSSLHGSGLAAAECLGRARQTMANHLDCNPDDLIFTSGATESIHLALLGAAAGLEAGRLVISAVEHPAVAAAAEQLKRKGWSLERWPVDRSGRVAMQHLDRLLAPPTRLVSIIWGQSEVGTIQPIPALAAACRERGICFHTDATQLIPQGVISWQRSCIDLLTFSSHKLQGPRGVGVLLHRPGVVAEAQLGGGGQEGGFRAGTEPVPLLAGLATALAELPAFDPEVEPAPPGASPAVRSGRDALQIRLASLAGVTVLNPDLDHRLPHHLACLIADAAGRPLSGRQLVRELSRLGLACSSGTACQSGQRQDSAVLTAMGIEPSWRQSLLRFTLGPWLSDADLAAVPEHLQTAILACA